MWVWDYLGISTVSIAWITPLLAATSVAITLDWSTTTPPLVATVNPFDVQFSGPEGWVAPDSLQLAWLIADANRMLYFCFIDQIHLQV